MPIPALQRCWKLSFLPILSPTIEQYTIDMTQVGNFHWYSTGRVRKNVFNHPLGIARNAKWTLKTPLGVARNRSYQFFANENQGEMHARERLRLQFDTSCNSQCHNETWFRFLLASARHSRDARMHDWKHFSSSHNTAK
jgi:hypothetical protein